MIILKIISILYLIHAIFMWRSLIEKDNNKEKDRKAMEYVLLISAFLTYIYVLMN